MVGNIVQKSVKCVHSATKDQASDARLLEVMFLQCTSGAHLSRRLSRYASVHSIVTAALWSRSSVLSQSFALKLETGCPSGDPIQSLNTILWRFGNNLARFSSASFPRGSMHTPAMELGPTNHTRDGLLVPNSIMVEYMDPLGFEVPQKGETARQDMPEFGNRASLSVCG